MQLGRTQTVLRPALPAVLLLKVPVHPVKHPGIDLRRAREADSKRKVMQAGDADRLVVGVPEDGGHRRKEYCRQNQISVADDATRVHAALTVHSPVDECHVDPQKLDDRLAHEEHERAGERLSDDDAPVPVCGVVDGANLPDGALLHIHGLADLIRFALEEDRRKGCTTAPRKYRVTTSPRHYALS